MTRSVLLIDDEETLRLMLNDLLTHEGYQVTPAADGQEGVEILERYGPDAFLFILCDIRMPRMDGLEFLERAKVLGCSATIIMMSAYGSLDIAVEALKQGAYDYLSKPFRTDEVLLTLRKAEEREKLLRENRELRESLCSAHDLGNVVAKSPQMQEVAGLIRRVADYNAAVLLVGESGVGKETLARTMHYSSKRRDARFLAVNCSAVPEYLLEAELFGQEGGGPGGAARSTPGALELGKGGTVYLKEIGKVPAFIQVRLLNALQEGRSRRAGGTAEYPVEARVMASCLTDLQQAVDEGTFREDLYYRLNVIPVHVSPLRERRDDIPPLVDQFIAKYAAESDKEIRGVAPDAMEAILRYGWKGNVRELENVIERAVVLAEGPVLAAEHLAPWLHDEQGRGVFGVLPDDYSIKKAAARVEEELIRRALRKTGGNRTEASKILEISHRTLLYKLKDYQIDA